MYSTAKVGSVRENEVPQKTARIHRQVWVLLVRIHSSKMFLLDIDHMKLERSTNI